MLIYKLCYTMRMRSTTIRKDYKAGDKFGYFLMSDLHLDSPEHDRKLLIRELDYAIKMNADILIGGDVFDFILKGDNKRFTNSRNKYPGEDAVLNHAIEEAFKVLSPYAKNIKAILLGNHEASVIKFHSIDILAMLIDRLNDLEGVNIDYCGYQAYIRIRYEYEKGNHCETYVIKATHGSGGGSPVTKGTISLNRYMNMYQADLYFSGHTHSKVILPCEPQGYLDQNGTPKWRERKAIVTGAYVKPIELEPTSKLGRANPYNINYGDNMKSLQSTGGVMIEHEFISSKEYITRIIA